MAAYDAWGGSWGSSWGLSWTGLHIRPAAQPASSPGVRRARFLRRAPKLPWEIEDEPEQQVTVAPPRRKRIPLPAVQAMRSAVGDAIPIQTVKEIAAPVISIPDVGRAAITIADEDEDDWLWLI